MTEIMPTRMVPAGEMVFSEGDAPDGLYYICYGEVEISREEPSGERSLAKLAPGGVFGEMALINSAPRNASVRALTDCGFYVMNVQNFQHKVEQLDPMMRGVFRVFVLTIRSFLADMEARKLAAQTAETQPADAAEGEPNESGGTSRKLLY